MLFTREQIIQNIKDCGQSLIDNAEKMIGDYQFFRDITITCYVNETDQAPMLTLMPVLFQRILLRELRVVIK